MQLLIKCLQALFFYNVLMSKNPPYMQLWQVLYLLIQELPGIFLNVSLIQVGGEAH